MKKIKPESDIEILASNLLQLKNYVEMINESYDKSLVDLSKLGILIETINELLIEKNVYTISEFKSKYASIETALKLENEKTIKIAQSKYKENFMNWLLNDCKEYGNA